MRAQQMEATLRKCQDLMRRHYMTAAYGDKGADLKEFVDMAQEIEEVLDRSPSGGKVDARVSNTLAARRPGSSPGTGTAKLLFGQVPGSATSHPDR